MRKHESCHNLDKLACKMMQLCTKMIVDAHDIDAKQELQALVDALRALHKKVSLVHEQTISEVH